MEKNYSSTMLHWCFAGFSGELLVSDADFGHVAHKLSRRLER
jgi:hypothetical protein